MGPKIPEIGVFQVVVAADGVQLVPAVQVHQPQRVSLRQRRRDWIPASGLEVEALGSGPVDVEVAADCVDPLARLAGGRCQVGPLREDSLR